MKLKILESYFLNQHRTDEHDEVAKAIVSEYIDNIDKYTIQDIFDKYITELEIEEDSRELLIDDILILLDKLHDDFKPIKFSDMYYIEKNYASKYNV